MRRIAFSVTILCSVLGVPLIGSARDVYVAKEGNDANPGTKETPLASIPKAIELMSGAGSGTIWVEPGEYFVETG